MIGHQDPCMHNQTFVLNTIIKAVNEDVPIKISGINIDPTFDCECDKVGPIAIVDLVFLAHWTKVRMSFICCKKWLWVVGILYAR